MSGQSFVLVQNPNAEQDSPLRRPEDRHRATPDGQADSEYPTQKRPIDASGFVPTADWVRMLESSLEVLSKFLGHVDERAT